MIAGGVFAAAAVCIGAAASQLLKLGDQSKYGRRVDGADELVGCEPADISTDDKRSVCSEHLCRGCTDHPNPGSRRSLFSGLLDHLEVVIEQHTCVLVVVSTMVRSLDAAAFETEAAFPL